MTNKQSFKDEYKKVMTNWTEQQLEEYADSLEKKYGTIKQGENVVHLEYYGGLIDEQDISTIETILSKSNLLLSRFDKNGVPYNSLEDFMLQVSLFIGDKTTQDVLLGLGTSALWDTIKTTSFYIWQTVRKRILIKSSKETNKQKKLNCGIKMSLDKNTKFEFKIDGDIKDEVALKSLDKVLDFLKSVQPNSTIKHPDFVVYNKEKETWEIVDVNTEIRKRFIESKENEKSDKKNKKKGSR